VSFYQFEDFYFFRQIAYHSLVGLDNGAMLLLGGNDYGSGVIGSQTQVHKISFPITLFNEDYYSLVTFAFMRFLFLFLSFLKIHFTPI
jgi:hypothetical protein